MSDIKIMPTKPGVLKPYDKRKLSEIGVIVVEVDEPDKLILIEADTMISGKGMLHAALNAVMESDRAKIRFAERIYKQACEAWPKQDKPHDH